MFIYRFIVHRWWCRGGMISSLEMLSQYSLSTEPTITASSCLNLPGNLPSEKDRLAKRTMISEKTDRQCRTREVGIISILEDLGRDELRSLWISWAVTAVTSDCLLSQSPGMSHPQQKAASSGDLVGDCQSNKESFFLSYISWLVLLYWRILLGLDMSAVLTV